ncbi:MAG TPA: DUF6094 domain-containing protein [Chloroflexia bacterium]|nr:DUF6094 domain-containing protein [Chloroflexia bacterium]
MARLIAVANGLYYPSPLRVVAGIARVLEIPADTAGRVLRILDPCAGRGSAALFLTRLLTCYAEPHKVTRAELFGIELHRNRAELAAPHFTRLLQTNALTARVEQKAFDLLFHNPPYHDSGDEDKRLEHAFLKRMTAYLRPGGILVHIVPQSRLAISAEFLAHYYQDIKVFRFPQSEYNVFKQVVLFGVRRETVLEDKTTAKQLKFLAEAGPKGLPPLNCPGEVAKLERLVEATNLPCYPEVSEELERLKVYPPLPDKYSLGVSDDEIKYTLTLSQSNRPVSLFASGEYNSIQALSEARQVGVWANRNLQELVGSHFEQNQGHMLHRPLTPLREGQAAMLTAVGLLNNLVLEDDDGLRVLVKGRTFKEYKLKKVEKDEDGSIKSRTEREVVKSQLSALDLQTGEVTEIEQVQMTAFVERFGNSIRRQMLSNYPPLYVPGQNNPTTCQLEAGLTRLGRKPLGGQAVAIVAGAYSLLLQNCAIFAAEMGVGKSLMGTAAAWLSGGRRVLVECPPQLVKKWVREILQTVPGAQAEIVSNVGELRAAIRRIRHFETELAKKGKSGDIGSDALPPYFVVISRTDLKLGSRWQGAAAFKRGRDAEGETVRLAYCPRCGSPVTDKDEKPLTLVEELGRKKLKCPAPRRIWQAEKKAWTDMACGKNGKPLLCDEPLWQTKCSPVPASSAAFTGSSVRLFAAPQDTLIQEGPRKVPLAHYIKSHLSGFFDTLIEDEVHEVKAEGSAQGACAGILAEAIKRVISLTGTLSGGKASNLFFILWRFSRDIRREFRLDEEDLWVQKYGIVERTIFTKSSDNREVEEDGAMSDRREFSHERRVEKPGMNPAILLKLIGCTVFLKLADVARDLPPYTEKVITLPLDGDAGDPNTQAGQYQKLETDLITAVKAALQNGSTRLLGAMANSLLAWPDNPTRTEIVLDPKDKKPVASAQALPEDKRYPKEQALVDLYRQERCSGRRMLVFLANTKSRSVVARVKGVLEEAGAKVAFLNSDRIKPEDREEWVAKQVQAGVDVLLSHPKPIQTGLDLLSFPTLVFWQLQYSTYIMRQASRRSWRIGQKLPITVYHMVYEGTAQHTGLTLIAKKVRASQVLEGELSNDGLVEMADDGEDGESLLELARAIAGNGNFSRRDTDHAAASVEKPLADGEMSSLSLEGLFNSLHEQELEAARFVLEDEKANPAELEAAIERIYASTISDAAALNGVPQTQISVKTEVGKHSTLPAPDETRQLVMSMPPAAPSTLTQVEIQGSKPTLEELREVLLTARHKKLAGNGRKRNTPVSPLQLSMF